MFVFEKTEKNEKEAEDGPLKKVCSDDWTCTKMLKQFYLKLNCYLF